VGQIALSLILLIAAGLMLRSLVRLQSVSLGFEPAGVLVADLTVEAEALRARGPRAEYLDRIANRVATVPGVTRAGIVTSLPLQGGLTEFVSAEGATNAPTLTSICFVSGESMQALQIPLRQGRWFAAGDNRVDAPRTVLLNTHLATLLFGQENPIGKRTRFAGQSWEVVGLTGDVLVRGVERGAFPAAYFSEVFAGAGGGDRHLVVRTELSPLSLASSVRAVVTAVAPDQAASNMRTFNQIVAEHAFTRRLMLGLLSSFAGMALLLAAIGLYGIMAFSVESRTHELGIRSALGASRKSIFLLVVSAGLKLTGVGIALGLIGGYFLTGFVSKFLYSIVATDPGTTVCVTALLVAIALVACWLPARRAAKIDPMVALRAE
jgi:putative ABC transport system permease protein